MPWTEHTRYTFHCRTTSPITRKDIADAVERKLGLTIDVQELSTNEHTVTWITIENEETFEALNDYLGKITGNYDLKPTREKIEVYR